MSPAADRAPRSVPTPPRRPASTGASACLLLLSATLLAGCGGADGAADGTPGGGSDGGGASADRPATSGLPRSGAFDYQLGGVSDGEFAVVVRDPADGPLPGAYSICYVNGFQTQPDEAELWAAHPELLLHDAHGEPVVDPEWPDELVLDPGTPARREGILARIGPEIDACAAAGFDAVELDNLDVGERFDQLDPDGVLALAGDYVDRAHAAGLEVAQKNAAELAPVGRAELGFDLAVVEECGAYDECAAYREAYGEAFVQIEYPDSLAAAGVTFSVVCADPDRAPLTVLRDRDLVPAGEPGHLREQC
ncbi:endo alpha-1,4 polygalactosaminidase [Brachybacterium sp. J153]|uniref:endo alpha-1,4 polygalactosaminidase n=1 Tax=Brachybacterium sp. J153 TaxID=3116488 RepID=UPI002E782DE5|nr:endo alpha-1,4 polygalactosaminidase [Brachybacterium sp. J153]MEE1617227.1 endo alpha-1,4 polygalactosaminidase [Brachybacterium sp. J153]